MPEVVFVTSNAHKLKEFEDILGFGLESANLELEEIQALSVERIAKHKVKQAYGILNKPVIVEDTGFYINELNGFPGALVKWMVEGLGFERICRLMDTCKDKSVYAETCIAYYDGKSLRTFMGKVEGTIADKPRGEPGRFGWDYIFIPKGYDKTFAEMDQKLKYGMSHRGIAVKKLGEFLNGPEKA